MAGWSWIQTKPLKASPILLCLEIVLILVINHNGVSTTTVGAPNVRTMSVMWHGTKTYIAHKEDSRRKRGKYCQRIQHYTMNTCTVITTDQQR
ncbi:hypothetical protein N657DRAFT_138714 [Parathielavia appendiculata]|uniref:Secreted protein n=1 Tax=Parathielavia appendiculata TaxID=2587402 RepID=A0AAN6Z0L0_9PEZI|nr:hypothetical protein N657DRAFT_138714 [Parathielavia appendiculata]